MRMIGIGVLFLVLGSYVLAAERTITVLADKLPALELAVPSEADVSTVQDKTIIHTTNMYLYVWPVAGARNLNEAHARLREVIKGDVVKFSVSATNEITVASAPARHLIGTGFEADDGDDATADVVIFAVGKHLFIACVHGEGNDAVRERAPMLKLLQTARIPQVQPAGK